MIILDTNVLSELMKPQGLPKIKLWVAQQIRTEVFITTITKAEILYGICIIPEGKRKQGLLETAEMMFQEDFKGKILDFDTTSAYYYAIIAAPRRQKGKPISQFDAQIASICRTHQATLATRNVDDFIECQINIINPWDL